MNDKLIKQLRKLIYRNADIHGGRTYITSEKGQVINAPGSLRQLYQDTKRLYKKDHCGK